MILYFGTLKFVFWVTLLKSLFLHLQTKSVSHSFYEFNKYCLFQLLIILFLSSFIFSEARASSRQKLFGYTFIVDYTQIPYGNTRKILFSSYSELMI